MPVRTAVMGGCHEIVDTFRRESRQIERGGYVQNVHWFGAKSWTFMHVFMADVKYEAYSVIRSQ
jgi:hypothetical protein